MMMSGNNCQHVQTGHMLNCSLGLIVLRSLAWTFPSFSRLLEDLPALHLKSLLLSRCHAEGLLHGVS